jgi:hypothetical protein
MDGFRVIGDDPGTGVPAGPASRREWVVAYVWRHVPAGSTLLYVWRDPRAFVVLGSGVPADPHSLKAVFGERITEDLTLHLPLRETSAAWRRHVAALALLAYGDEGALLARVRP